MNVTRIGEGAFQSRGITSVVVPSSVKHIGYEAFRWNSITNLSAPDNLEIGEWAFEGSPGKLSSNFRYLQLTETAIILGCNGNCSADLEIPEVIDGLSVVIVGAGSFENNQLSSVVIPSTIKHIGNYAFAYNNLSEVTIPSNETKIGYAAFYNNPGYIFSGWRYFKVSSEAYLVGCAVDCPLDIVIPNNIAGLPVHRIQAFAFENKGLTSVILPESVTYIGRDSFKDNALTEINLSENISFIGYGAFESNLLTNIIVPEGVTIIGDGTFAGNQLTNVSLPSTITRIVEHAFTSNQITEILIPDGVSILEEIVFANNQLTNISIPYSIKKIEYEALSDNQLETVNFMGNRPDFDFYEQSANGKFLSGNNISTITYCPKTTGWPGESIENITPILDVNCDSDNDGVINTEDAFPFDSSRHLGDIQYSALDLDQNGSFDALTDALILLRYAFGLRGNSLVDGAIASDATRTSTAEIEAHIQSLLP
jgi:hypothetical protein